MSFACAVAFLFVTLHTGVVLKKVYEGIIMLNHLCFCPTFRIDDKSNAVNGMRSFVREKFKWGG
jgi:hypothetical protein